MLFRKKKICEIKHRNSSCRAEEVWGWGAYITDKCQQSLKLGMLYNKTHTPASFTVLSTIICDHTVITYNMAINRWHLPSYNSWSSSFTMLSLQHISWATLTMRHIKFTVRIQAQSTDCDCMWDVSPAAAQMATGQTIWLNSSKWQASCKTQKPTWLQCETHKHDATFIN